MVDAHTDRQAAFQSVIKAFLKERLENKLDKLAEDDPGRPELVAQYTLQSWLPDAARRVGQIQAVTHSLKPIHPDARGTNLYCPPSSLPQVKAVSSAALPDDFEADVVGNAAALDVYKFLRLEANNTRLLDAMLAGDPDLAAALGDNPEEVRAWIEAFCGLVRPRGSLASHTLAKQIYWLSGDDPLDDSAFELLAPLYATSLAHTAYLRINEDRFGDTAKAARQAQRDHKDWPSGYSDYADLAIQKLGGTKPQNISQLNSERRGNNYLLGSLPPSWTSKAIRPIYGTSSALQRFAQRQLVRQVLADMLHFLEENPDPVESTRRQRDDFLDVLIDELHCFANEIHDELQPGWTNESGCTLVLAEQLWLDPQRALADEAFRLEWQKLDWPAEVGKRFGEWLNTKLDHRLPMGEVEQRHWARELLNDEEWRTSIRIQKEKMREAGRVREEEGA